MQNSTSNLSSSSPGSEQRRVAIYLRTATGDRPSMERQLQNCVNYCSLKLGPDPEFVVQDFGISGMLLERDGLNSLISVIRSGQVTDIIVADIARLGRSLAHVTSLMQLCESNNVIIHETAKSSPVSALNLFETEAERHSNRLVQSMSAGRRRLKQR
jgi:DNA invertase Pin-like site-specific DNA recombinase